MRHWCIWLPLMVLLLGSGVAWGQNVEPSPPLRIAYFDSGKTWKPADVHTSLMRALKRRGVAHAVTLPPELNVVFSPNTTWEQNLRQARALMNMPDVSAILAVGLMATKALLQENNGKTPVIAVNLPDAMDFGILDPKTGQPLAGNFSCFTSLDVQYLGIIQISKVLPFTRMGFILDAASLRQPGRSVRGLREAAREVGFALSEYAMPDASPEECRRAVDSLIAEGIDAFIIPQFGCFNWVDDDPLTHELLEKLTAHKIFTIGTTAGEHVRGGALMGLYNQTVSVAGEYFAAQLIRRLRLPATGEDAPPSGMTTTFNMETAARLGVDLSIPILLLSDGIMDSDVPALKEY